MGLAPADVRLVDGQLLVDQSALTGESVPVDLENGTLPTAVDGGPGGGHRSDQLGRAPLSLSERRRGQTDLLTENYGRTDGLQRFPAMLAVGSDPLAARPQARPCRRRPGKWRGSGHGRGESSEFTRRS